MIRMLASLALVTAACSKSSDPKPSPPAAGSATTTTTTSSADPKLVKFCAQCYFKVMDCFKDEQFWQVFSTMYFANTNLTSTDADREHWIGVMKEDMLKLYTEHGFEQNCQVSLEHNKAPSEKSVKAVTEAANTSCAAFASAFGYMVFNEGALHDPK